MILLSILATIHNWLRAYQLRFLRDFSLRRVYLKSRQIGISDVIALEMVLVSSGFLKKHVLTHNCTLISKSEEDAKDVIEKAVRWCAILALDPDIGYLFEVKSNAKRIRFLHSGRSIRCLAQSPKAGRGVSGHLYLDEYAFYAWQTAIWTGATPSTISKAGLRITVVSTPNGTGEHFHELCNSERFKGWSRHYTDIYQAVADGHPVDIQDVQDNVCANNAEFLQEYCCDFAAGSQEYLSRLLYTSALAERPRGAGRRRYLGIDVASEQDLTAVHLLEDVDGIPYHRHTYIITGVPYGTKAGKVRGQDALIDALMRYWGASSVEMDATGDGAKLFGYLLRYGWTNITPHTFTREWKELRVPQYRGALERGEMFVDSARADIAFAPGMAATFPVGDDGRIRDEDLRAFVETAFVNMGYEQLMMDHLKVRKKLTVQNQTTFVTSRDADTGHGDAFWAALLAWDVWLATRGKYSELHDEPTALTASSPHDELWEPEYESMW